MAKRKRKGLKKEMRGQIKAVLLLALAVFALIALFKPTQGGKAAFLFNSLLRSLAGEGALVIPLLLVLAALLVLLPAGRNRFRHRLTGFIILPFLLITYLHLKYLEAAALAGSGFAFFSESIKLGLAQAGGGALGAILGTSLYLSLGPLGGRLFIGAVGLISLLLIFDFSLKKFAAALKRLATNILKLTGRTLKGLAGALKMALKGVFKKSKAQLIISGQEESTKAATFKVTGEAENQTAALSTLPKVLQVPEGGSPGSKEEIIYGEKEARAAGHNNDSAAAGAGAATSKFKPAEGKPAAGQDYLFPPLNLLSRPQQNEPDQAKISSKRAKLLESTLFSFGVMARVTHVQTGPTVTRFEVQPEAGVKVSRISSLADDLALNLEAPLVRIEAPIPGKAAVGIEVPNKVISLVALREVLEDPVFAKNSSPLTIGLGKDIAGNTVVADLIKMPHLLIAGATGAGKSACLNTIINSIFYKAGPGEVRFLMIDPKVVELSIYNAVPHLLMPVLTDPRQASLALRNLVREMGRRYDLFAQLTVRDITTYNELASNDEELEKLAYLVVIIDELADLMIVSPGEVEDSIARLSQMSRAAGIHLVVATQRPSVDVLTGIIKANITSRIAFTVSSQVDSRTILDTAGAEKLLGSGDMLFYPVGAVKPFRVQGAYVSESEVKRVTDFLKEQNLKVFAEESVFLENSEIKTADEADELFGEAIDLVVKTGQASISLLQRRFRIGYTRAARLIDDLELKGVVGPFEGSKPREVLISDEQAETLINEFNDD